MVEELPRPPEATANEEDDFSTRLALLQRRAWLKNELFTAWRHASQTREWSSQASLPTMQSQAGDNMQGLEQITAKPKRQTCTILVQAS